METTPTPNTPAVEPTPSSSNALWIVIGVLLVVAAGLVWWGNQNAAPSDDELINEDSAAMVVEPSSEVSNTTELAIDTELVIDEQPSTSAIKEFSMDSFVEFVDGQAKPQYSVKEITVKKGDRVKITVTVTKGNHDFNIDEFNIHQATQQNEPVTVEFTADTAGEFVYYCSMPGHRAAGHWGTLRVIE